MVQLLLDRGADVNTSLSRGPGSLAAAAFLENPAVVQVLLDRGADVNASLSGRYGSALAAAAASRRDQISLSRFSFVRGMVLWNLSQGNMGGLWEKLLVEGAFMELACRNRQWIEYQWLTPRN